MERTASSRAHRSGFERLVSWRIRRTTLAARAAAGEAVEEATADRKAAAEATVSEHFTDVHSAARRDVAHDGRRRARGVCRVPAAAGLGAASGRLSDDADPDVLSGRQPGSRD